MRRIDFLGPHGIGKSTLYEHLIRLSPDRLWMTPREARREVARMQLLQRRRPRDLAKWMTCLLPRVGDVFINAYTTRTAERAFVTTSEGYQAFFNYCLDDVLRHRPSTPRGSSSHPLHYVNLNWLYERLLELSLLESLDATVVFDDSLAHCTVGLLCDRDDLSWARLHFEKMPAPQVAVHLAAPEDVVHRRLMARTEDHSPAPIRQTDSTPDELLQLVRRGLRLAELGASTLQWRGVQVVALDAQDPPRENAARLAEEIRTAASD